MSKNEITYFEQKNIHRDSLLDLYNDAHWKAYTNDIKLLVQAIQHSLYVAVAHDGNQLVGLVRVVGDGATIAYVQDILILSSHKRKQIGSRLMKMVQDKFGHVRQLVLLTDDNPETRGFYEALGFSSCDQGKLVSFVKMK